MCVYTSLTTPQSSHFKLLFPHTIFNNQYHNFTKSISPKALSIISSHLIKKVFPSIRTAVLGQLWPVRTTELPFLENYCNFRAHNSIQTSPRATEHLTLTVLVTFPCTRPSTKSWDLNSLTKLSRDSRERPSIKARYLSIIDQRAYSRIKSRTSLFRGQKKSFVVLKWIFR